MFKSKFNLTLISITLTFVMLISALAASYVIPTRAQPTTLWAVLSPDPFWGYYGGYWDIWYSIKPELAKIGITLELSYQNDIYDVWYLVWGPDVPEGGRPGGEPSKGWDTIMMEWWTQPQGMLWQDGIILSRNLINGPLSGFNPFPYLSKENDEFYWGMQTNFDVNTRKAYADAWQEELMHNPPVINVYCPHIYVIHADYFQGYDEYVWEQDVTHVQLNQTRINELEALGLLSTETIDRVRNQKTIIFGASEAWWSYMNPYCDSYSEERFQTLVHKTLYGMSIDPWPATHAPAPPEDYNVVPLLAESDPIDVGEETDWDGEQVYRVRVPLREGMKWSDFATSGEFIDAQDVVWSYNNITLNFDFGASAAGDFAPIVKRAEYLGNYTPASPSYDPYTLDLILYEPYVDLTLILSNDWGLAVMPYHHFYPQYGGAGFPYQCNENQVFQHAVNVPVSGPFKYLEEGTPSGYSSITLERNDLYFGYNASIVGTTWGPYNVDKWIFEYVEDAAVRLGKLELHEVDYCEYPTAPVEVFEGFIGLPDFAVNIDKYVATNPLWLNLNNPDLSNRYFRLALAHTIPYADIFKDILPSWGIVNPIPGGSLLQPWSYYLGTALWNSELGLYTYDIAKAQQYLDMYLYSKTGSDYTKGCVGDANFDGIVDLDDLYYWIEEYGNAPLTRTLEDADWLDPDWYTTYPWPKDGGPVAPGNDIDPDFNNNGIVGPEDFGLWLANVGKEYPFSGAW